jgi:hypothetical protein
MRRAAMLALLCGLVLAAPAAGASAPILIGHSLQGRPITAVRVGDPDSPRKALIVGNTHGDEPDSWVVAKALERRPGIHGVDLWIVDTINPDGLALGTRKNARGVIDEWERHAIPGTDAFVVEFGADRPSDAVIERHVRAALALAEGLAAPARAPAQQPTRRPSPSRAPPASALLSRIGAGAATLAGRLGG